MNVHIKSAATTLTLQVLRGYKWLISPLFPPACRYVPTCSEYAMEAVERYGVVRGGLLAGWRLLRCHPFARGGYDPLVNKDRPEWREIPCDPASASSAASPETQRLTAFNRRARRISAEHAENGPLHRRSGAVRPGTV